MRVCWWFARWMAVLGLGLAVAACSSSSPPPKRSKSTASKPPTTRTAAAGNRKSLSNIQAEGDGREVVMYALGLLDVGYKFGGSNPEAGLDCSGMAAFIYKNALKVTLPHNAKQIAETTRSVPVSKMRAGDMVFFNTMDRPFSHMGIYIGDGKFIHAPRTNSVIKVETLSTGYFSARIDGARTVFD